MASFCFHSINHLFCTSHALIRACVRVGLDCQKLNQSGLFSKRPDMRSVGDIALNRFAEVNVNKDKTNLRYRINSSCNVFLSIYTFIILTMRLSVQRN